MQKLLWLLAALFLFSCENGTGKLNKTISTKDRINQEKSADTNMEAKISNLLSQSTIFPHSINIAATFDTNFSGSEAKIVALKTADLGSSLIRYLNLSITIKSNHEFSNSTLFFCIIMFSE